MKKRKNEGKIYLTQNNQDGLDGILWAKEKIKEFEEYIKEKKKGIPKTIYCSWTDNRRRNVYERGLKNLGYQFTMLYGMKVLAKTII